MSAIIIRIKVLVITFKNKYTTKILIFKLNSSLDNEINKFKNTINIQLLSHIHIIKFECNDNRHNGFYYNGRKS